MAEYDRRESGTLRIDVEGRDVMQHVQLQWPGLDDLNQGQCVRPVACVDIPTNGERWRDAPELFEDLRVSNVAGVNDQVRAVQRLHRLRTKEAVGVGDDTDCDGRRTHQGYGSVLIA